MPVRQRHAKKAATVPKWYNDGVGILILSFAGCQSAFVQITLVAGPARLDRAARYRARKGVFRPADACGSIASGVMEIRMHKPMMTRLAALVVLLSCQPAHAVTAAPSANAEPPDRGGHAMPSSASAGPSAARPLKVADIEPIDRLPLDGLTQPKDIPPSGAPDVVGAFRLVCNMAHLSYDDPIAFPGRPGKSHLHMFFGNTATDAHSDYASLRSTGEGTCQGGALNRSAYWIPALLASPEGRQVVVPDNVALYYKRRPKDDPECERAPVGGGGHCAGIPVGLRAIFGNNYIQDDRESLHVRFDCNSDAGSFPSLSEAVAACEGADHIYVRVEAPDCWDGVNLDSADHQSHLAYMFYDGTRNTPRCPETHPVTMPKLTLTVVYAVLPGDTPGTWVFSSDLMAGAKPGTTFHADYMEAWEPRARLTWETHCIDRLLNCAGGDLGDGRAMKAPEGFTFEQRPHLVPVPGDAERSAPQG